MSSKRLLSIAVFLVVLMFFTMSSVCFQALACECGTYHEKPFHVGDDIITLTESRSGSGWQWDCATRTLTLTNANISNTIPEPFEPSYPGESRPEIPGKYLYDKVDNNVVQLPPNSTIILNGNNTVTPVESDTIYSFGSAIYCVDQSLTVKGGGSLVSNGKIAAHRLVFNGVNVSVYKNETSEYGCDGVTCYELYIKNSIVKNNASTSFVAELDMTNSVLYTKNAEGGKMPGAIYFFENYDTSKYDVKYKTSTGYDGEVVFGNTEDVGTFFEKGSSNNIPASDIVIKDKTSTTGATSSNKAQNSSKVSTTSKTATSSNSSKVQSSSITEISSVASTSSNNNENIVQEDTVKIKYNNNTFPAGTVVLVAPISSGETYRSTQTALLDVASEFVVYDINAINNEIKVQPNGTVSATFKIPSNYDVEKTCIYYVGEKEIEKIPSSVNKEEMTISAELSHFSVYAVVEENISVVNNGNNNSIYIVAIAAAVIIAFALIVFLVLRKQKIKERNL